MRRAVTAFAPVLALFLAGAGQDAALPTVEPMQQAPAAAVRPLLVPGYIPAEKALDGMALVPPPPAQDSAEMARDRREEKAEGLPQPHGQHRAADGAGNQQRGWNGKAGRGCGRWHRAAPAAAQHVIPVAAGTTAPGARGSHAWHRPG